MAAVVGCIVGGLWQMGVYGERQDKAAVAADAETIEGRFLGSPFFLPDGAGKTWVVEPFAETGTREALLVVRGYGTSAPPADAKQVKAVLLPSDAVVRLPRLINQTEVPLRDEYGISLTDTGLPLVPLPKDDVAWTVGARNLAYAMQWWVFGAFAIVMWWRICNDQVKQPGQSIGESE